MLPPLAVPQLIHDEHQASLLGPGNSHVLQFALRLRRVMAVAEQNARHRLPRLGRFVKISRHQQSWPALEDEIFDLVAIAAKCAGDSFVQACWWVRGSSQPFQPSVAKCFPVLLRLHLSPGSSFALVGLAATLADIRSKHLGQQLLLVLARTDAGVKLLKNLNQRLIRQQRCRGRQEKRNEDPGRGCVSHGKTPGERICKVIYAGDKPDERRESTTPQLSRIFRPRDEWPFCQTCR